jgi:hypothetical protein
MKTPKSSRDRALNKKREKEEEKLLKKESSKGPFK